MKGKVNVHLHFKTNDAKCAGSAIVTGRNYVFRGNKYSGDGMSDDIAIA
jgi:hypothetical protein